MPLGGPRHGSESTGSPPVHFGHIGGFSLGETGLVTGLTTSKVGSITGVEEDPRFAFIAKALYGIRYLRGGRSAKRYAVGDDDVVGVHLMLLYPLVCITDPK